MEPEIKKNGLPVDSPLKEPTICLERGHFHVVDLVVPSMISSLEWLQRCIFPNPLHCSASCLLSPYLLNVFVSLNFNVPLTPMCLCCLSTGILSPLQFPFLFLTPFLIQSSLEHLMYRSGEGVLVAPGQSVVAGTCRSKQRARLEVGIVL